MSLETTATRAIDQNAGILRGLAEKIWNCPETAFNEVNACRWTAEVLQNAGFDVEVGYEKGVYFRS